MKILQHSLHQNPSVQILPVSQVPLQHDDGHPSEFPSKDEKMQCKCIFFTLFPEYRLCKCLEYSSEHSSTRSFKIIQNNDIPKSNSTF